MAVSHSCFRQNGKHGFIWRRKQAHLGRETTDDGWQEMDMQGFALPSTVVNR